MKKRITSFLVLLLTATSLFSQKDKNRIDGTWLMTRAETSKGIEEPYFITTLTPDGKLVIMGMELGTWSYDTSNHTLTYKSDFPDKDMNGDSKVLKVNKQEMIVVKNNNKLFYTRLDTLAIAAANTHSSLSGKWQIHKENNTLVVLKFELPDHFSWVEAEDGSTESYSGTWIWNPAKEEVILVCLKRDLRGKTGVTISGDKMTLTLSSGATLTASRMKTEENAIEHLTFQEEDFPEESNAEGLPASWLEMDEMVEALKDIKEVHYRFGRLIPEAGNIHYTPAISRITVNTEKPSIRFTNYMVEYGDTVQHSEKYKGGLSGMYDYFFPQDEIGPFRIQGKEKITVPAGTFTCTVVEGMDGDTKVKYWMIDKKPGIYARIIRETPDPFNKDETDYTIEELTEIR